MYPIPKTSHNFKIQRLNGVTYDLYEKGILVDRFIPSSPDPIHEQEEITGADGFIDGGTRYGGRTLTAECKMFGESFIDYSLFEHEIMQMFDSKEPFYIIRDAQPNKRWLVKLNVSYTIEQMIYWGDFTLEFISPSAYCESIGTTMDALTFDSDKWQLGQGILAEETKYKFKEKRFRVYNPGDTTVNAEEYSLTIAFKGQSKQLGIRNLSTGEQFKHYGETAANEILVLRDIEHLKNDKNIMHETNHELISLIPGWNDFAITGTINTFEVLFDCRFYYLV